PRPSCPPPPTASCRRCSGQRTRTWLPRGRCCAGFRSGWWTSRGVSPWISPPPPPKWSGCAGPPTSLVTTSSPASPRCCPLQCGDRCRPLPLLRPWSRRAAWLVRTASRFAP
ncbi:hypothetical protein KEM52_002632, partial [Ascosphaera acerosa]